MPPGEDRFIELRAQPIGLRLKVLAHPRKPTPLRAKLRTSLGFTTGNLKSGSTALWDLDFLTNDSGKPPF